MISRRRRLARSLPISCLGELALTTSSICVLAKSLHLLGPSWMRIFASVSQHLHNHIYIVNHDNLTGKALSRCRSWSRGLRQVNDELMRDEGCQVLPDPEQPKPDWDLRRGAFKDGGFEQVLAEHKVRLRVTERDGWTYSMRRVDNYKWAGARRRRRRRVFPALFPR